MKIKLTVNSTGKLTPASRDKLRSMIITKHEVIGNPLASVVIREIEKKAAAHGVQRIVSKGAISNHLPNHSPSPGGEGRDEGELKTD